MLLDLEAQKVWMRVRRKFLGGWRNRLDLFLKKAILRKIFFYFSKMTWTPDAEPLQIDLIEWQENPFVEATQNFIELVVNSISEETRYSVLSIWELKVAIIEKWSLDDFNGNVDVILLKNENEKISMIFKNEKLNLSEICNYLNCLEYTPTWIIEWNILTNFSWTTTKLSNDEILIALHSQPEIEIITAEEFLEQLQISNPQMYAIHQENFQEAENTWNPIVKVLIFYLSLGKKVKFIRKPNLPKETEIN